MNFLKSNQLIQTGKSPIFNKVSIVANHLINPKINLELIIALEIVEDEMNKQNINIDELKELNLYLFTNGSLEMELTDPGNQVQFASINCDIIERVVEESHRVAIIVEELVHFFWQITDEYKIKFIVSYLVKSRYSQYNLEELFDLTTIQEEQKIQKRLLNPNAFDNKI